jgi:hypothetical protein
MSFYDKLKNAKYIKDSDDEKYLQLNEINLDDYLISKLYQEENIDDDYDCSTSLLNEFPVREQLRIIDEFVNNIYAYYHTGGSNLFGMEILKYIYTIWPKYMLDNNMNDILYENRPKVYPHKDFFELLYSIKSNLITFSKMENSEITSFRRLKKITYPYFNLLGCLPLLRNGGKMLEIILSKQCYSDAEEYIYFALFNFPSKEFYPHLKRILLNNDEPKPPYNTCSIDIWPDNIRKIIELYKIQGIDMINDPDLESFFINYNIL